ncbi:phosphodiester glycosidase family protein [Streptococcus sanguinis]|uniref:phosphodiester glycosidase family protein n=1 Tax=Streptococcus sanguinis TaxID=1305 RepID=UPI001CBF3D8F|nr:phosphodiester glycosidase family protein [Streptococcus sanguinis]MBZ2073559.1 phosphodiester glycosidase family protein [Streptococcus sanguinis]MBZ2081483.1 phosphodiester glycosidase family protein [Streptococcus sanguinis]
MKFLKKRYAYASIFGLLLTASFSYSMLKTFVIAENISTVSSTSSSSNAEAASKAVETATVTDTSYSDDNISVTLTEKTVSNTQVYIADVTVSSSEYLKTAFAQNTYGNNVTAKTSETAANNNAILAINGDYYGANTTGYVIRNGVVYRDTVREDSSNGDLAIYKDGSFKIIYEDQVSADQLVKDGVVNLLAFGPSLVENGEIVVDTNSEVGQSMSSNPRTAIGIIDENHYIIIVSDGRTSESEGLSLYQMAEIMKSYGVKTAYNLDGGGSSTLYFTGQVINKPTTNGNTISERSVSDIVYIGY